MRVLKEELETKYREEAALQNLEFVGSPKNGFGVYKHKSCGHSFEYQITAVRSLFKQNASVHCPTCLKDYKNKLLKEYNLEVIEEVGMKGQPIFRRKDCGHTLKVSYKYFEEQKSKECKQCESEKIANEAIEKGLEIIGRYKSVNIYKLPCGHTKRIQPNLVRNNGWRCIDCYEEKVKSSALEYGFEYIGESSKGAHYRLCKIINCGHYKDVQIHDITGRPRKGVCKECIELKHKEEALNAGLELIGEASNKDPNYRKYKTACCGTEHDFMVTHIRRDSFICPTCETSHLDYESYLYLLKIKDLKSEWLKFGYSCNVKHRIESYGLTEDCEVTILKITKICTGREALKLEKNIHKKFKNNKIDSSLMKSKFLISGFNECYPIDMKNTFVREMEVIENEQH